MEEDRTLYFLGLGLRAEHITGQAMKALKISKTILVEGYTSFYYPDLKSFMRKQVFSDNILFVNRRMLEEESGRIIWESLADGSVSLAVIGDPFISTTHNSLRAEAYRRGIRTVYIPGINIYSYAVSVSGLFNYKFGASATIVEPWGEVLSEHPYRILMENRERGLHTLFYLDITGDGKPMDAGRALRLLMEIEESTGKGVIGLNDKVVIIEHASWPDEKILYMRIEDAIVRHRHNPPQVIIVPGRLHFMEKEVLEAYRA